MADRITGVLVFDGRPDNKAIVRKSMLAGALVTSTTGPRGPRGFAGDQNVLVLGVGEDVPPGTPAGKIIYQLLEE